MSRPYTAKRGWYEVKDARGSTVQRPTKLAAGMTATSARRGVAGRYSKDALQLMVKGHCSAGLGLGWFTTTRTAVSLCPCCHQPVRKRVLNEHGRKRLAMLRRQRAHRLQSIAQQETPA